MNWKNWPYWLKGGVIGGGVTVIWVFFFFGCTLVEGSSGGFLCLAPLFFGPLFPVAFVFDSANAFFNGHLPFLLLPVASIALWFFIGAIVGVAVGAVKKRGVHQR